MLKRRGVSNQRLDLELDGTGGGELWLEYSGESNSLLSDT